MILRLATVTAVCLSLSLASAVGLGAKNPLSGKKLIQYGHPIPDTADMKLKIRDMEKISFDGVCIKVMAPGVMDVGQSSLGWKVFSKVKLMPEQYEHAIADLKAVKSTRLTDNFIQVLAMPGDIDWFDPEWSTVAYNAACLAKVAKQGGCKGIMFDAEDYSKYHIWNYSQMPAEWQASHTFEEYLSKVKERGKEFIRAINAEFPDLTMLCFVGPSYTYVMSQEKEQKKTEYGLLAAFFDGMCEAATPGTVIVDGYEMSYGYRERKQFQEGRKIILENTKSISTNPKAFAKHMRAGFGIWTDNMTRFVGWHGDDFSKNYFTPAGFRAALAYAMEVSDGYVWVYNEEPRWWDFKIPQEYIEALALAKTGPGPGEKNPIDITKVKRPLPKAEDVGGYSDANTFEMMYKTMTEVMDFPKDGWRFKRDESRSGTKLGWHRADFDDSDWRTISIGRFYEELGESYDGISWYRTDFTAPEEVKGKRVYLAVGAADESARIWLNGRFIGEHNIGVDGWNTPFSFEITRALRAGEENTLAIELNDRAEVGGLWKSVKLMVKSQ